MTHLDIHATTLDHPSTPLGTGQSPHSSSGSRQHKVTFTGWWTLPLGLPTENSQGAGHTVLANIQKMWGEDGRRIEIRRVGRKGRGKEKVQNRA